MRKIVLLLNMSLDGFFEGPRHELDWHRVDDELHQHFNDVLGAMSTFLDGRVTHEMMAAFWPHADEDPANDAPMREFARIWREMPKVVYSRTLQHADWNATIAREVVPAEIHKLKAEPGGDMAVGGANLAATFTRHGLIDEYRVYVQPVILGAGNPLFPPSETRLPLSLIETRRFANGVVLLRYGRA
jgi:dihydrofolate reductase